MKKVKWIKLCDLDNGSVFQTKTGCKAVKTQYYYPSGGIKVVLLKTGEYGHFCQNLEISLEERNEIHNTTLVRKLYVSARPPT